MPVLDDVTIGPDTANYTTFRLFAPEAVLGQSEVEVLGVRGGRQTKGTEKYIPSDGCYYELLSHKTPLVLINHITAGGWVNSFFTAVPTTSGVGSGSSWHQDRDNRD